MAKTNDVKLLGNLTSPFVLRSRIALDLKSIEYEFIHDNFGVTGIKSELLLNSNPIHKKIPVLFHGDRQPLCESLVIVEYIDEVWYSGFSILPSDPYDRTVARFWAAYIDDKWFPSMKEIAITYASDDAKMTAIAKAKEGIALIEEAYVKISKGKAFFGGDSIGYIDIAFGCFLSWLRAIELMTEQTLIDEASTPGLAEWANHFSSDAAVRRLLPDPPELVEFAKVLRARMKASG